MSILDIFGKLRAVPYSETPKAEEGRAWDAAAARARLSDWAGENWSKYRRGFAWYDAEDSEKKGSYKLPHHDVADGELVVVWRGVAASMAALLGARGGVDIPDSDVDAVYGHLSRHYKQFDKEPPARSAAATQAEPILEMPGRVEGGILEPTDEDMKRINSFARGALTAEQVYVFEAIVSTDSLNAWDLRMAESSLANFVEDAQAGNPLLAGHDGRLPIGKSFWGERRRIGAMDAVVVRDYMLRGHEADGIAADHVARGIQGGIHTDMSIGWGGRRGWWWRCNLCGKDMLSEECPHVPGVSYAGVEAFGWIEDAHMREHSIVDEGADPGAAILAAALKARTMAAEGKLSAADVSRLEDRWGVKLIGSKSLPDDPGVGNEEDTMTGRDLLNRLKGLFGANIGEKLDTARGEIAEDASAETGFARAEPVLKDAAAELRFAGELKELGIETIEKAREIASLAKEGEAYRKELVEQALAEGVRAQGEQFDKTLWTKLLSEPGRSIEDIKKFRDQFAEEAKAKLGKPGRQTTPPEPGAAKLGGPEDAEEAAKNAEAFRKLTGPPGVKPAPKKDEDK